jgi:uncharacterized protein (UPF0254 family)
MRRVRTDAQIYSSGYITLTELKRLYGYGNVSAKKIFDKAAEIDQETFGVNRVFVQMVRISSVRKVLGINPQANKKAV